MLRHCVRLSVAAQIHMKIGVRSLSKMAVEATPLVSAKWLNDQMKSADFKDKIRILDATWHLPIFKRNFIQEHREARIPGAKFFR